MKMIPICNTSNEFININRVNSISCIYSAIYGRNIIINYDKNDSFQFGSGSHISIALNEDMRDEIQIRGPNVGSDVINHVFVAKFLEDYAI